MIGIKRHWQGVTLSTDCYFLYRRMFITNNFITAWCIARNMLSQDALWRYWLIVPRCVSIRVFTVLCHKTSLRHKLNYHIMWDKDILLDKALTSDCTRALRARAAPRHWMKVKTQELYASPLIDRRLTTPARYGACQLSRVGYTSRRLDSAWARQIRRDSNMLNFDEWQHSPWTGYYVTSSVCGGTLDRTLQL